jgi:hypothetical protein
MGSNIRWTALLALWLAAAWGTPALAEGKATVVVTPGSEQLYRAAIQRFADLSPTPLAKRVGSFREALEAALEFSGVFKSLDPKAFLGPEATEALEGGPPVICSDWTQIGADALVEGEIRDEGGSLQIAFRVWDTVRCRDLLRRRYSQSAGADPVPIARRIADDIVEAFVGVRGVASTEIACGRQRGARGHRQPLDQPVPELVAGRKRDPLHVVPDCESALSLCDRSWGAQAGASALPRTATSVPGCLRPRRRAARPRDEYRRLL